MRGGHRTSNPATSNQQPHCGLQPADCTVVGMHTPLRLVLAASAVLTLLPATAARAESAEERGRYLVEEVAKCGDCHTAALETGAPDRARHLKGATLPFAPIQAVPKWHKSAPDLTPAGRLFQRWG